MENGEYEHLGSKRNVNLILANICNDLETRTTGLSKEVKIQLEEVWPRRALLYDDKKLTKHLVSINQHHQMLRKVNYESLTNIARWCKEVRIVDCEAGQIILIEQLANIAIKNIIIAFKMAREEMKEWYRIPHQSRKKIAKKYESLLNIIKENFVPKKDNENEDKLR